MNATQNRPAYAAPPIYNPGPNAALLIDFDNVTMKDVQKDLGKELKSVLNSEVIRGKVAVRRAYADWRRYPQYIVPLTEASVDLIYAPAYGSAKKNATDLRMAIDAIELVFIRPEIGTFILLTGDSDFSSCVLKLKEYGKYVIGVGMRESSSDLLIQNCDEYYSYHALSGLTRTGEVVESQEDPWMLVKRAAQRMVTNGDVMRTDRLKQVMLDLDPSFDEKGLGYSKFSRFVSEAAKKGLVRLNRMENGQYEILLDGTATEAAAPAAAPEPRSSSSSSRGRSSDRRRSTPPAEIRPAAMPEPIVGADDSAPAVASAAAPAAETPALAAAVANHMPAAYALLQKAVRALSTNGSGVRDGDVKRRMLDLVPEFDESNLGFPKFSRFLRQAHEDDIVDLNRVGAGHYEVRLVPNGPRLDLETAAAAAMPASATAAATPTAELSAVPTVRPEAAPAPVEQVVTPVAPRRGRRGGTPAGPPPILPGQVVAVPAVAEAESDQAAAAELAQAEQPDTAPAPRTSRRAPAPEASSEAAAAATPEPEAATPPARGRRGRRGRSAPAADAPPPILPGQAIAVGDVEAGAADASSAPAAEAEPTPPRRGRGRGRASAPKPAAVQATTGAFDASALGLPGDDAAIRAYLSNSYRGVGQKTADNLLEALGTDLFRTMTEQPERVREVLGDRRADALLEQWSADRERRESRGATNPESASDAEPSPESEAGSAPNGDEPERSGRSRSRRGGRGRGRARSDPTPA